MNGQIRDHFSWFGWLGGVKSNKKSVASLAAIFAHCTHFWGCFSERRFWSVPDIRMQASIGVIGAKLGTYSSLCGETKILTETETFFRE